MKSMAKPTSPGPRTRIENVLVLADAEKKDVRGLLAALEPWLRARVKKVAVEPDARAFYRAREKASGTRKSAPPDLLVVLGGDGAILGAVRAFGDTPVPTIGINFGRVGFLASAEAGYWQEALAEVLEGRIVVEPRLRIDAELVAADGTIVRSTALNDVVLTRGAFQGLLEIALRIGEEWVTNYRADGLIVATASGSTAYSLASGGPILAPTMPDLVVTPICPQALSHRTIVLPSASGLSLSITSASGITTLVVDGQGFYPMKKGDVVRLRRHPETWPLLARPGEDFFQRLRERLGWRGSFEPDVFPPRAAEDRPSIEPDGGGTL
jgi:NAD+ kinase